MADVWFARDHAGAPALGDLLAQAPSDLLAAAGHTGTGGTGSNAAVARSAEGAGQAHAGVASVHRDDDEWRNQPLI
jgi:hypothetical protein